MSDIKEKYEEAFEYLCGDWQLWNPQKAFSIFCELSEDGFVAAQFYCGIMICMGLGTNKGFDEGKKVLKDLENTLGYKTELLIEQFGLFDRLNKEEQLTCIEYWKRNRYR